jgi:hypothetical protein
MEDVASVAHAAIVKRDWGALQPLLHPYLHWVQADGQVVRGRTKVIGMLQAIGISGPGFDRRTPTVIVSHTTPDDVPAGGVYTFVRSPHLAPVLLGAGTRLLDNDDGHIRLQPTRITESSKATHLRYRVLTVDGTG